MAKKAWDVLKARDPAKYGKLRDVYNDQDLSGGDLPEVQTMASRLVICIIGAVMVAFLFYAAWCFVATSTESLASTASSASDSELNAETVDGVSSFGVSEDGEYQYSSDAFREYHAQQDVAEDVSGIGDGNSSASSDEYEYSSSLFREYYGLEGEKQSSGSYESQDTGSEGIVVIPDESTGAYEEIGYDDDAAFSYDGSDADVMPENAGAEGAAPEDLGGSMSVKKTAGKMIDWRPRSFTHVFMSVVVGLGFYLFLYEYMKRNLQAQNMLADMSDLNQHKNDQHIALPEELMQKFDYFPDVGAHSNVSPNAMISHIMLQNKGINPVKMPERYKKDVIDADTGETVYYKGEIIYEQPGVPAEYRTVPMFDEKFAADLFEASGMPKDVRKSFDVHKFEYNPGGTNRDRMKYETVADLINCDWILPDYEPQRPAGAYITDVDPVNVMVLAITRAGKGQTYIEPMIDMWLREIRGNNIVVNDPKGELLKKFYVRAAFRGYEIIQLNLINAMKTNICNPLWLASSCAREGDFKNCAMYVENIATVFFPVDGSDEPMWPNAANNAFKRAVYGMIDAYLEEEKEYRNECTRRIMDGEFIDPQTIENHVDELWGRVTLYNCYQMFVQLSSKKLKNPVQEVNTKIKNGFYEKEGLAKGMSAEAIEDWKQQESNDALTRSSLWNGSPEMDCLSLYFAATEKLPRNSIRTELGNADNSLKAMAGSEKMLSRQLTGDLLKRQMAA